MDLGLKDKVAVVTGAGSQLGFGRAIAVTLAKAFWYHISSKSRKECYFNSETKQREGKY